MIKDRKLLAHARQLAVQEATSEFINSNRKQIIELAKPKIEHIYSKLCVNTRAGKPIQ